MDDFEMRNFESSDVDYSDQASFIDLNDFDWEGKLLDMVFYEINYTWDLEIETSVAKDRRLPINIKTTN